jgi:PIN domain nuclease of toxin-antitoxin system
MPEPVLLLDTHVWIWIVEGMEDKLSSLCIERIRVANQQDRLLLSAISVWEVAILEMKKKISLCMSCQEWVHRGLSDYGVELADLSPEVAIESTRLPGGFHADPADRIIVATARNRNATVVTVDRAILAYSRSKHVRAIDARG